MRIELPKEFRSPRVLCEAFGCPLHQNLGASKEISGISTDSREVQKGDLFVAFKGAHTDGSFYLQQAIDNGAVGVLGSTTPPKDSDLCCFATQDPVSALLRAAAYRRRKAGAYVIAVSGSVGKTTAKEAISCVLGDVPHSKGNFNSLIGMPLSVLSLPDAPFWVLELGINHIGEMERMARTLRPDLGVLTGVGSAHIGELGGYEGIAREKCRLSYFLKEGGRFLLPNGMLQKSGAFLAPSCHLLTFGKKKDADFSAENIVMSDQLVKCDLHAKNRVVTDLVWPTAGESGLFAIMIAGSVGVLCGKSDAQIRQGLLKAGRSLPHINEYQKDGVLWIDDSYNASAESMMHALEVLRLRFANARRIAVLGDMLELGGYSCRLHETVGEKAAEVEVSHLFTYGTQAIHIANGARRAGLSYCAITHFEKGQEKLLISALKNEASPGAVVLFKASRAMRMERIMEGLGLKNEK